MTDDLIKRSDAEEIVCSGFGRKHMQNAVRTLPAADLSSPLGAVAMRDAALKAIMDIWAELLPKMFELELQHPAQSEIDAIRAIPLPTHAALLAHAMRLPEVAALVAFAHSFRGRLDVHFVEDREMADEIDPILAALEAKP